MQRFASIATEGAILDVSQSTVCFFVRGRRFEGYRYSEVMTFLS